MYPAYPSFSVPVFPGALPAPGKKQKEAKLNLVKRNCKEVFHGKRRASSLLPSLPTLPSSSGPHPSCPLLSPGSTSPWLSLLSDWLLLLLLSSASRFYPACLPLCSSMSAAPHPWDAKWEAVSTSTTQVVKETQKTWEAGHGHEPHKGPLKMSHYLTSWRKTARLMQPRLEDRVHKLQVCVWLFCPWLTKKKRKKEKREVLRSSSLSKFSLSGSSDFNVGRRQIWRREWVANCLQGDRQRKFCFYSEQTAEMETSKTYRSGEKLRITHQTVNPS